MVLTMLLGSQLAQAHVGALTDVSGQTKDSPKILESENKQASDNLTHEPEEKEKRSKFGIGLGVGWINDYPGSSDGRMRYLPFPIYRGDRFRLDRLDGMSGRVGNTKRWKFSWSFVFQFPTESKLITERIGMADLDWMLSIGPMIEWDLYKVKNHRLFLRFPLRLNTCTNFGTMTRYCGISFNPGIRYSHDTASYGNFTLRLESFLDSTEYNKYFYEVPDFAVNAGRPRYRARSGMLGFVGSLIHTIYFNKWDIVTALNYYDYGLSINRASPLFVTPTNTSIFVAFAIDL